MARCGCQGAGSTTCEAIVRCTAGSLGTGLTYTNGRIEIRISRDAGNCLQLGSDRGLYAACEGGGSGGGGKTIDGLPDHVIGGTNGGAGLIQAYASPYAIEYAVSNLVDIIDVYSWALNDDVAAWSPYSPQTTINIYTDSPSTDPGRNLSSVEWTGLNSDAGVPGGNPTGRYSGAPSDLLTPDGGWYGFLQRPYPLMTTIQALRMVGARSVVILQHGHEGSYDISANAQAILSVQGQTWVMPSVLPTSLTAIPTYRDLAIPHVCVNVGTNTTITAQQIVDAGATWVKIVEDQGDERITEFIDAGLNVLTGRNGRQTTATHVLNDLGVRGVLSHDPVYQRGALGAEWLGYRSANLTLNTRSTEVGLLTEQTDRQIILSGRGYAKTNDPGRAFPSRWNWEGTTPRVGSSQLLGKICPVPNPDNFTVSCDFQVDQLTLPEGTSPKLGFIVGNDNDLDTSYPVGSTPPPTRHGYQIFMRVGTGQTGTLVIGQYDANGVYTMIAESETAFPVTPNEWFTLSVRVTPDDITLTRTDGTQYSVTATNTDWRGPYVFVMWEDLLSSSGEGFDHIHANIRRIDGGGGNVVWDQLAQTYGTWDELSTDKPTWDQASTMTPGMSP